MTAEDGVDGGDGGRGGAVLISDHFPQRTPDPQTLQRAIIHSRCLHVPQVTVPKVAHHDAH